MFGSPYFELKWLLLAHYAHSNVPQRTEELDVAREVRNMETNGGPRIPIKIISSSTQTDPNDDQNDAVPNIGPSQIEQLVDRRLYHPQMLAKLQQERLMLIREL